jgi:HAD superfamily hydrolase (TIGR01457 family)
VRPVEAYDAFLLDLDGVLYRGDEAVPGARETVAGLRRAERKIVFLTNNSARTPDQVAEKLERLGIEASPNEVVTSAEATAPLIARMADEESLQRTAFVIGERGLREALDGAGIEVLDGEPEEVGFVVVGWDRGLNYQKLRTATVLVDRGARFVATNSDASYPAPGGEKWPGAGALLAAVEAASDVRATVVGKPHLPLFREALERAGDGPALMVGDRIETDVAGAEAAGIDAALVLTGASGPSDLLDHDALPVMILEGPRGLLEDRSPRRPRPAGDADIEAIRGLLRSADLDPGDVGGSPAGTVVVEDGDVEATASASVRDDQAYVHSVAVTEDARGDGLGTLVTAAAIRWAAGEGARTAYLLTATAVPFFERLGFEKFDRQDVPGWIAQRSAACPEGAIAMRRGVAPPA